MAISRARRCPGRSSRRSGPLFLRHPPDDNVARPFRRWFLELHDKLFGGYLRDAGPGELVLSPLRCKCVSPPRARLPAYDAHRIVERCSKGATHVGREIIAVANGQKPLSAYLGERDRDEAPGLYEPGWFLIPYGRVRAKGWWPYMKPYVFADQGIGPKWQERQRQVAGVLERIAGGTDTRDLMVAVYFLRGTDM